MQRDDKTPAKRDFWQFLNATSVTSRRVDPAIAHPRPDGQAPLTFCDARAAALDGLYQVSLYK